MSEAETSQDTLFAVSQPGVIRVKRKQGSTKPRWSKYRPKNPIKCDDCMLVLALAKGNGPATRQARWKRVQDGADLLLCYGHAAARREDDGLEPLKDAD